MGIIKSVVNILFYFLIFLIIISLFYIFLFLHPIDYFVFGNRDLFMHNFLFLTASYFYPIALMASTITILFFGAMNSSHKTRFSSLIAIFLFSVFMLLYPAYLMSTDETFKDNLVMNSNVFKQSNNLPFYIEPNRINDYVGYSIYAGDKITGNSYSGVIISENKNNYNIYISEVGVLDNNIITLYDFDLIDYAGNISEDKNSIELLISEDKGMTSIFSEYIFSPKSLSILNSILYLFSFSELGFMSLVFALILLFLFFVGCYFLSMSLASPIHLYHNLLTTIILYIIFRLNISLYTKLFNINAQSIIDSNIIIVSFVIILICLLINIAAFIISKIFRFSEFYSR